MWHYIELLSKIKSLSPYLGAGSDHAAFAQLVGLPCIDQTYTRERVTYNLTLRKIYIN